MPEQINEIPKYIDTDSSDPRFTTHYSQVVDAVNGLLGYRGSIPLQGHLNLKGNRIMQVGAAQEPTDAVSSLITEARYSPAVIAPKLESGGSHALKSVRRVNDPNQREQVSSYLNDLMSSVPSANQIFPTLSTSGGNIQVVLPASLFTFADGSTVQLVSRTDLLTEPASYVIATISCSGNTVTIVLTAGSPLTAGQVINVAGVNPAAFNGSWQLTSSTSGGSVLTFQLSLGTVSGSGGTVEANGVYYYTVQKRRTLINLIGPFTADTAQNRLQANFDGNQIVAVVVITASGGQVSQSGGGGSPITGSPAAGSFF